MNSSSSRDWSLARRIAFRFLFLYWAFFDIPQDGSASVFDMLPWSNERVNAWLAKPMQPVALWLGQHLFHLQGIAATFHPTGSGDTSLNYVLVFICLCLAVVGTVVWSLLDRKRTEYRTLDAWLRLFVAFVLAESLVEYGFAKIFPSQFGPIHMSRLNETYGESSPMALMWTFMSGSRWYTMFGGFAEVVPGVLLFFRRTRTVGALMAAAVLLNIVMLNFCYDIPVKIYSTHLLLMAIFLLWPDLAGLVRLFFFRGQTQFRTDHVPAAERVWLRRVGYALPVLLLVCTLWTVGVGAYQPYPVTNTQAPLYGQWHIDKAMSTTAMVPWREISVSGGPSIVIRRVDGTGISLSMKIDLAQGTATVTSKKYGDSVLQVKPDAADPRHVVIAGPFNAGQISIDMHRRSPDSYLLLTRGFHWVNEETPNY